MVAMKFTLTAFTPLWTAFGRMSLGALTVGLWAYQRPVPLRPERHEWRSLGILTALFTVQIAMLNYGVDWTSPAYSVVLINSNPIFANLIAHFFVPADRLSFSRACLAWPSPLAAFALFFSGTPEPRLAPDPLAGNLIMVATAMSSSAARTVYAQRVLQWIEPGRFALWQMLLSLPFFATAARSWPVSEQRLPVTWVPLVALAYQGIVVAGVCFTIWAYLLRRHSPGSLTVFSFTVPIFGVIVSAWLFAEPLTLDLLIGVAAVAGGIWLVARTPKPLRPATILPES